MSSGLPTPRQLLTSLVDAIAQIPPPPPTRPDQNHERSQTVITTDPSAIAARSNTAATNITTTDNPLRLIPQAQRPLLATLHVLFPSLLLPALDLLDRGLVARLRLVAAPSGARGGDRSHQGDADVDVSMDGDVRIMTDAAGARDDDEEGRGGGEASSCVYQVRSARNNNNNDDRHHQKKLSSSRRARGGGGGGDVVYYVVHTAAWSCTCAAFAFAAFPSPFPAAAPPSSGAAPAAEDEDERRQRRHEVVGGWRFGGYADYGGRDDGEHATPPCCKHLLACVLAERWEGVLGRYVDRRDVGREEMAGVFAGI